MLVEYSLFMIHTVSFSSPPPPSRHLIIPNLALIDATTCNRIRIDRLAIAILPLTTYLHI